MTDYRQLARATASRYGVDPDIFERQIQQESGFNPGAVSGAGARGLGQLMPGTAKELGVNPDDPKQNLDGAARYMRQQLDRFGGDYAKALAAYNAGPGNVEKYGGIPPFRETQDYVAKIKGGGQAPKPSATPAALPDREQGPFGTPMAGAPSAMEAVRASLNPAAAGALAGLGAVSSSDPMAQRFAAATRRATVNSPLGSMEDAGKGLFDGLDDLFGTSQPKPQSSSGGLGGAGVSSGADGEQFTGIGPKTATLAKGKLVPTGAGLCTTAVLESMAANKLPNPAATGMDAGNNPRGLASQLVRGFGYRSLPGLGKPQKIKSPYGEFTANVMDNDEYQKAIEAGRIPSGAISFASRYDDWNGSAEGSRGFDAAIVQNGGRNHYNGSMVGSQVYGDQKKVFVLVDTAG